MPTALPGGPRSGSGGAGSRPDGKAGARPARQDRCRHRRAVGRSYRIARTICIEARPREDGRIGLLINNAGATLAGGFANPDLDAQDRLIRLNVTAVTRLAGAVVPRFLAEGSGAIVNIASVVALAPEIFPGIYAATKSFVLTFSQALQAELGPRGLYVQAVLPAASARKSGSAPDETWTTSRA